MKRIVALILLILLLLSSCGVMTLVFLSKEQREKEIPEEKHYAPELVGSVGAFPEQGVNDIIFQAVKI